MFEPETTDPADAADAAAVVCAAVPVAAAVTGADDVCEEDTGVAAVPADPLEEVLVHPATRTTVTTLNTIKRLTYEIFMVLPLV